MKKFFVMTIVFIIMFGAATVRAEVIEKAFLVTPLAGGYFFEGNESRKNIGIIGLRAGHNFTEHVGLEAYFHYGVTERQDLAGEPRQKIAGYGIDCLYNFFPEKRLVPFLALGLGGIRYGLGASNKLVVDYGGGLKYTLPTKLADFLFASNIALRADVRHIFPFKERYNNFLCTLGVEFSFGGVRKAAMPTKVEIPAPVKKEDAPKFELPAQVEEPAPKVEAPAPVVEPAPVEEVAPAVEAPAAEVEAPAPVAEVTVAPPAAVSTDQDDVKDLVAKWLNSWRTGDMETYRSCYASDFRSKGMNLDGWINYKKNVRKRSKDITIDIDNLQISVKEDTAMATFIQSYSSSILKDKGKKTLELRKTDNQWKINREIM